MNYLKTFNEINELVTTLNTYSWQKEEEKLNDRTILSVLYTFTTDNNENYEVLFRNYSSISYGAKEKPYKWYRNFFTKEKSYSMTDTHDVYKVLSTISKITADFLNNYDVDILTIEHIPTNREDINRNISNKRARVNKLFLQKYIPNEYEYKLKGSVSTISKKQND